MEHPRLTLLLRGQYADYLEARHKTEPAQKLKEQAASIEKIRRLTGSPSSLVLILNFGQSFVSLIPQPNHSENTLIRVMDRGLVWRKKWRGRELVSKHALDFVDKEFDCSNHAS